METVYLDNAATTCLRKSVLDAMVHSLQTCYGNPSSTYHVGRDAKSAVETARKSVANHLSASPGEIIFTSGGTEADNMIIQGAVQYLGVQSIITSKIEHHAVLHSIDKMQLIHHVNVRYVSLTPDGSVDLGHLEQLLKADGSKKLVSLMHVNNEIGNILDIDAVSALCQAYGALFHSDTVQSIGHRRWNLQTSKVDFLAASAHKFHGPKGVGFAYVRKQTGLKSLICGGGQERGMRAGTEPVASIVGLERALTDAYENLSQEQAYISGLKAYFIERLKIYFPNCRFNGLSGDLHKSAYNLINVYFPDFPTDKALMLHFLLDMKGIACSRGSACQSGSMAGSHVLSEILPEEWLGKPSLRFSLSHYNTEAEIDYAVSELKKIADGA